MADDQDDQQTTDDTGAAAVNVTDQLADDPGMPTNAPSERLPLRNRPGTSQGLIEVQLNDQVHSNNQRPYARFVERQYGAFNQALEELPRPGSDLYLPQC